MNTTWIDIRKVLLEDENEQTQQYAVGLPNAVEVGAKNTNTTKWVYIPVTLNRFNFVRVGYQYKRWPTDCRSKISKVAILKMAAPGHQPTLIYDEDVCLNSETYRFFTIPTLKAGDPCKSLPPALTTCEDEPFDSNAPPGDTLPLFFSQEGFFLALQIEIVDFRDRFVIGPVGIEDHTSAILEVSPMDFGAVGDGVADDFEALQETVSFALANRLPIDLAHRTYAFNQTLHIQPAQPNDEGFTLRNGELRYTSSSGAALLVDKGGSFTPVHMANVAIIGKSDTGLDLGRASGSLFERVRVAGGFKVGLRVRGSVSNAFSNCDFRDNELNVQIETYEPGSKRSNDNKFWNCNLIGSTGFASLNISDAPGSPGLTAANNAFYACNFENSSQHAVAINGGHGTSFIDCRFEQAYLDTAQPHPWSMIRLDKGRNSRIVNCWVPGMNTPTNDDYIVRVAPQHVGTRIIDSVFSGSQQILFDPANNVASYGNWALPNNF